MNETIVSMGLTSLRNAQKANKRVVVIPTNRMMNSIVGILSDQGYIDSYEILKQNKKFKVRILLKDFPEPGTKAFREIGLLSKSSLRWYCKAKSIPRLRNGYVTVIMSTPKGVMTGKQAKLKNVGGEPICYVF